MDGFVIEMIQTNPSNKSWVDSQANLVSKCRYINYSSDEMFRNPDVLPRMLINYFTKRGQKITAYNMYKQGRDSFFMLFKDYNAELHDNYPNYNLYYSFAKNNLIRFNDINFIVRNIMLLLESSFTIKITTVNVRRKKVNTLQKNISINYITPHKRFQLVVRSLAIFSKSFSFEKSHNQLAFGILNTFLSHKNSTLYQKKVFTFKKLVQLKKLN